MIRTVAAVRGMSCAMCENHINEAVRKAFPIRKVSSSRKKNVTEIISDAPLNLDALRDVIIGTGYEVGDITSQPYENKGLRLPFMHV